MGNAVVVEYPTEQAQIVEKLEALRQSDFGGNDPKMSAENCVAALAQLNAVRQELNGALKGLDLLQDYIENAYCFLGDTRI